MAYDSLGRKISMHDPDMGDWTYAYDLNGNLAKQVDAKGQLDGKAIFFSYDALNRVTYKDYPALNTHIVTYLYDETWSANAKGRVTSMSDAAGTSTKYYYDPFGRQKKIIKHVDNYYTLQYSYDGLGRLKTLTYPDGEVVSYRYDTGGGGNLAGVVDNTDNSDYATYSDYTALGQFRNVTFKNGVTTDYSYQLSNSMLSTIFTSNGQQTLLDLAYQYDNVGNISIIADNTPGRLAAPHFDEYSSYAYGSNHIKPHAVMQDIISGATFTYDPNGNMTADNMRTIAYDQDNMPLSIQMNGNATSFVYDGTGARVKKISPSGTTVYIGKLYECRSAGDCVKYIFAGNTRIAQKGMGTGDTVYYHLDQLGSTSAMSNSAGIKEEDAQYLPFGEMRLDTGLLSMSHKYTSQEFDDETSLYYYNARYYNPSLGRFIGADTIVPNPTNPQSLNRYAYVGNNPISYADPTGHRRQRQNQHARFFQNRYSSIALHVAASAIGDEYYGAGSAVLGAYEAYATGSNFKGIVRHTVISWGTSVASSYIQGWDVDSLAGYTGQAVASGVVGGASAHAQGGKFSDGFYMSALSSVAESIYAHSGGEYANGKGPNPAPGVGVDDKTTFDFDPDDPIGDLIPSGTVPVANSRSNNFGLANCNGGWVCAIAGEGSIPMTVLDLVPGMNAVSVLHDIWNPGAGKGLWFISSMPVSGAVTYGALLNGNAAVSLAVSQSAR